MSENDYNHLSTREKNEMVLYYETYGGGKQ